MFCITHFNIFNSSICTDGSFCNPVTQGYTVSDYSLRLWIKILHWFCLIYVTEFPSWGICVKVPIIYAFAVFSTARFAMWIQFLQFFLSLTVISLRRIPQRNMYTLKLRCLMLSAVISEKKWHISKWKKVSPDINVTFTHWLIKDSCTVAE